VRFFAFACRLSAQKGDAADTNFLFTNPIKYGKMKRAFEKRGDIVRLDKFLTVTATATRSEAARAVRADAVLVNGVPAKSASVHIDPERDTVEFCGKPVVYRAHHYIILNKPEGYVSATEDGKDPTVLELLPPKYTALGLFPCGRLDKNTKGLMLLTDDGDLAHRLLSPRRHVAKRYYFRVKFPLSAEDAAALEAGVDIGGYVTAPCRVERLADVDGVCREGRITLHEGKYHQIKLMMEARHNQITALARTDFGPLTLDPALAPGEWRLLAPAEIAALEAAGA